MNDDDKFALAALRHIQKKAEDATGAVPPNVRLFIAVFDGDVEGVKEAIEDGADVDSRLGSVLVEHSRYLDGFDAGDFGELKSAQG